MKMKKTVWIPAIMAIAAAALLLAYYYTFSADGGGGPGRFPGSENEEEEVGSIFTALGTIAVFVGAAGFSWFWFKKKLKSPSVIVRKAGKLFHSMHKILGGVTLALIAVHGVYFLLTKFREPNIYSGLASFVMLLAIAGYGFFINKVRNKWMRTVHRTLGLLWVPVLIIHAGGSAIAATAASLSVGGLVWVLERREKESVNPVSGKRSS